MISVTHGLFTYSSLEIFLESYAKKMKEKNHSFSVNAWAKKLNLPNAASITRVMTGERTITEGMINSLLDYFNFTSLEREYFYYLVLRHKSRIDPVLQQALGRSCWPLPETTPAFALQKPLLEMGQGQILGLVGEADLGKLNALLKNDELECIPVNDQALVYLNVCRYQNSSVGSYSEFYTSVLCRPIGASISDIGLWFTNMICTNSIIANLGTMVWGNRYSMGQIGMDERMAEVSINGKPVLAFRPEARPGKLTALPHQADLWGFATVHGARRRFKISLQSQGVEFPFDSQKDRFQLGEGAEARLLTELEFEPKYWHQRKDVACSVSRSLSSG
jgi:hypothetical protein